MLQVTAAYPAREERRQQAKAAALTKAAHADLMDTAAVAAMAQQLEAEASAARRAHESLGSLLNEAGLAHLQSVLSGLSLSECCEELQAAGRSGYLKALKERGVEKLADRQKLASALAKSAKAAAEPELT
jgi:hypothetical protein